MSYRCHVCKAKVPHGHSRIVHVITRLVPTSRVVAIPINPLIPQEKKGDKSGVVMENRQGTRQEIAAEIPVCQACKLLLDSGVPFRTLVQEYGRYQAVKMPERPKMLGK